MTKKEIVVDRTDVEYFWKMGKLKATDCRACWAELNCDCECNTCKQARMTRTIYGEHDEKYSTLVNLMRRLRESLRQSNESK